LSDEGKVTVQNEDHVAGAAEVWAHEMSVRELERFSGDRASCFGLCALGREREREW